MPGRHELTDAEWALLAPLMPDDAPKGKKWADHRKVINAILFRTRRPAQKFLRWTMTSRLMPRLLIPHRNTANPAPIGHDKRMQLLRRAVEDEELDLMDRVVVVLALLFAQPLSRICRLTLDDLVEEDKRLSIRFGDPPAPVPEPFADLLRDFAARRPNLTTATKPGARWLFPGRRAGQPMDTSTFAHRMRKKGLPTFTRRTAAIRQLAPPGPGTGRCPDARLPPRSHHRPGGRDGKPVVSLRPRQPRRVRSAVKQG
ncbi:hypothetical protein KIK06_17600 [Nocardiopsis sp. EMB25]|uniref:transposase n=1 Tax=Nocardiopsis sp. EMB25 TaxID=2835867 RepID=UPI002283F6A6|nr:transposase [Nocardiopsis sp. EMB25]MCY9785704.1 hypothetical protein [Nocardiopsis sp. EMB25]